ncbi:MAG: TlpA disulfide reductase family protein [Bacteroidota bacterium]
MPRPLLLATLVLLASPALAQEAPPDSALSLVYQAYGPVLSGIAIEFSFVMTLSTPDTTLYESGLAVTHVDAETETARFRIDYDGGEISVATLNDETYQVAFPRTQKVYVDSTREEMYSGTASILALHPAFGADLFYFASASERALVGTDSVSSVPCTRATYTVGQDSTLFAASICFDHATLLPIEIRTTNADSVETVTEFGPFQAVEIPGPEAFEIPIREGYERAPYDSDQPALAADQTAPDFTLPDASGELVSLTDHRGQYVLVDFWGTWCGPCVTAIPHLVQLEQTYPELVILGLASYEYEDDDPTSFIRERGGQYPILLADEATLETYQVEAFPTYYLVNPEGTIVFSGIPDRDPETTDRLDALLADIYSE